MLGERLRLHTRFRKPVGEARRLAVEPGLSDRGGDAGRGQPDEA